MTSNHKRSVAMLEAAGYRCAPGGGGLADWDVIGISVADVVLVRVATGDWPTEAELAVLRSFPLPANGHRLVHLWREASWSPEVRAL